MTAMTNVRRFVVALTLPVLLVACGGDDDDDAATGSNETETTEATESDTADGGAATCPAAAGVSGAVGMEVGDAEVSEIGADVQCLYEVTEEGQTGLVAIRHTVSDADTNEQIFTDVLDDEEAVDGLGDAAWWSPSLENLFVREGDETVDILLSSFLADIDALAVSTALAELALG